MFLIGVACVFNNNFVVKGIKCETIPSGLQQVDNYSNTTYRFLIVHILLHVDSTVSTLLHSTVLLGLSYNTCD